MCVVKYLMEHVTFSDGPLGGADSDIPYALFEEILNEAAIGPFATAQEKRKPERKYSDRCVVVCNSLSIIMKIFLVFVLLITLLKKKLLIEEFTWIINQSFNYIYMLNLMDRHS